MSSKRITLILLTTAAVWSTCGYAQSAKSDAQVTLEREQATLSQQIVVKQQQLTALHNRPSPEQAEMVEAERAANDARAAYKADASADNEAKLKNAEFKATLAERKFNKANGDVEALTDEVDKLRAQVTAKQTQIKALSQQASEQQTAAANAQAQRLTEERNKRQAQEQELQRTKQETENQQKEIERLKGLLAAKEAANAKEAAAAPVKAAPVEVAKAAPVAVAAPAPVAASTAAAQSASVANKGLYRLVSQQEVVQELQQLEKRLAAGNKQHGGISDAMYLKHPNTTATNKDKVSLKALGQEQYRGESQIEAGSYEMVIGFNHWPVEISSADSGSYVFLYDNSDPQKPRVLFYNRKLEG